MTVEIRDSLTLELLSTLQPTRPNAYYPLTPHQCALAYSPDGCSLACPYDTGIIIWDIQTGGLAKEIKCNGVNIVSLVWSMEGGSICTIFEDGRPGNWTVQIFDTASATALAYDMLQSSDKPYLWAHSESFWVMATTQVTAARVTKGVQGMRSMPWITRRVGSVIQAQPSGWMISIFEVGSTLTKINSFPVHLGKGNITINSFSPITYHTSISTSIPEHHHLIFDIRNSKLLLEEAGSEFSFHSFSSDGSYFIASSEGGIHIWKYNSGCYTLWGNFSCQEHRSYLQLSPTSLSILSSFQNILKVWRLDDLPVPLSTSPHKQHIILSHHGAYVATVYHNKNTITITNLSENLYESIETDMKVEGLFLTGNILLAVGHQKIVAWLLTEKGIVDGVPSDMQPDDSHSIWTIPLPGWDLDTPMFLVENQTGIIKPDGNTLHVYHIETGEVLGPTRAPLHSSSPWYCLRDILGGHYYHHCCDLRHDNPPEDDWPVSQTTLLQGWVKDSVGNHRLWLPVGWRTSCSQGYWLYDIKTLQFRVSGDKPVLIKF